MGSFLQNMPLKLVGKEWKHFKYGISFEEYTTHVQLKITASFAQGQSYPYKAHAMSKKWKELTDSITHFIVCLYIHTVIESGFKEMIKKFDSRYVVPPAQVFLYAAMLFITLTKKQSTLYISICDH